MRSEWRLRASRRGASSLLWAVVLAVAPLGAQPAGKPILLEIRPRLGDTLYTRFEQQEEMTGKRRLGGVDTIITMSRSMVMFSHVVVEKSDKTGTVVQTVTDSVGVSASGGRDTFLPEAIRRSLQGSRVRMRITPEGSATVVDNRNSLPPELQSLSSQMPASLPPKPVTVGSTWSQVLAIPLAGQPAGASAATLHSTFRLDSISRSGTTAFISMRGTLTRDSSAAKLPEGHTLMSSGSMEGVIVVDLKRRWWTDSRATISVNSTLSPGSGPGGQPVRVHSRITTWMRTAAKP